MNNFPIYNQGQAITAQTAGNVVLIADTPAKVAAEDVMLYNAGPSTVHAIVGDAGAVANTQCMPLPPGTLQVFGKGRHTHLALIAVGANQPILCFVGSGD